MGCFCDKFALFYIKYNIKIYSDSGCTLFSDQATPFYKTTVIFSYDLYYELMYTPLYLAPHITKRLPKNKNMVCLLYIYIECISNIYIKYST